MNAIAKRNEILISFARLHSSELKGIALNNVHMQLMKRAVCVLVIKSKRNLAVGKSMSAHISAVHTVLKTKRFELQLNFF